MDIAVHGIIHRGDVLGVARDRGVCHDGIGIWGFINGFELQPLVMDPKVGRFDIFGVPLVLVGAIDGFAGGSFPGRKAKEMFSTCWKSNFSLGFPSDLAGHKFPTGQGALNCAHEPHGHLKAHPELWNLSPMVPHVQPWLCSPASLTRIKFAEILVIKRIFQCCAHIPGSPSSSSSWRRRCRQAVIPRGWEHRINDRNAPSSPTQAGHIPLGRFPSC